MGKLDKELWPLSLVLTACKLFNNYLHCPVLWNLHSNTGEFTSRDIGEFALHDFKLNLSQRYTLLPNPTVPSSWQSVPVSVNNSVLSKTNMVNNLVKCSYIVIMLSASHIRLLEYIDKSILECKTVMKDAMFLVLSQTF